jgi:hypothetical protein
MSDEIEQERKAAKEQVAAKYPDRDVQAVALVTGETEWFFVLTSPNRDEWRKYRTEISKAGDDDIAIEGAVERAALAQIRFPERDEVKKVFERKPGLILSFAALLSKLAGLSAEAVEKK